MKLIFNMGYGLEDYYYHLDPERHKMGAWDKIATVYDRNPEHVELCNALEVPTMNNTIEYKKITYKKL